MQPGVGLAPPGGETGTLRRGDEPPRLGVGLRVSPRDREGTTPVTKDQHGRLWDKKVLTG